MSVSKTTGEPFYSGTFQDVKEILRVMNIGEGKMAQLQQSDVEFYQEFVDRDCDAILASSYQVPIRSYNQTKIVDTGISPISVEATAGVQNINAGDSVVTVSGQAWGFLPTSVIGVVSKPSGDFNIYVTVREDTITTDGFVADLSAVAGVGYSFSYIALATIGVPAGVQVITPGDSIVTVSGQAWGFLPTSVIVAVLKPSGGFDIFATVREDTITTDGFIADLSAVAGVGYSLSYIVSAPGSTGTTVRVFPGDVRRAALYWTAGQILISEFQQLEANLTEQATQMVSDARMQIYAMVRTNHRIPGQRRISWSKTMPPNLQPNAFPERPS